ncbi:MAG TPA: hypothetical protein VI341_03720 [Actinomycetota bacterium]
MRRVSIVIVACALGMVMTPAVQAGMPMDKVVGGPGDQYAPSSNGTLVAYTEYRRRHADAYVEDPETGHRMRANRAGTAGAQGSFIAGTNEIVYQEFTNKRSNLYFFDTDDRDRSPAPKKVNEPGWEYWPVGSQDYLLFLRATNKFRTRSLILFDRDTQRSRTLFSGGPKLSLYPNFVGSRYAAWVRCAHDRCTVSIFDTVSGHTSKLQTPAGMEDYAVTIDESTGTVYFARGPWNRCGAGAMIRRAAIGSNDSALIVRLPRGIDLGYIMSLATNPDTAMLDLYVTRWECRAEKADVYAIRSVDATTRRTAPGPRIEGPGVDDRPMPTAGAG